MFSKYNSSFDRTEIYCTKYNITSRKLWIVFSHYNIEFIVELTNIDIEKRPVNYTGNRHAKRTNYGEIRTPFDFYTYAAGISLLIQIRKISGLLMDQALKFYGTERHIIYIFFLRRCLHLDIVTDREAWNM